MNTGFSCRRTIARLSLFVELGLWLPAFVAHAEDAAVREPIELDAATRERCLAVLRDGLRGDDFWPAMHAAEGLSVAGFGAEVRAALVSRLASETDDQRRCGLARELVRAGELRCVRVMLEILAGADPYGHIHAAESLFKVGELGDGAPLRGAFHAAASPRLHVMSAAALARGGNRQAQEALRARLEDSDPEIARTAAWVLARVGDSTDIAALRDCRDTAVDPLTKAYYEHALAALGDPEGLAALVGNLSHSDRAVRTYAGEFAVDAWATAAREPLVERLDDPHADAAIRAAHALLALAQSPPPDRDADHSAIVYEATNVNPRYTEGSIVRLDDGALLYATTEFGGDGNDFATAHIVARTSSDGGRTWGPQRILQENTGRQNVMSVTLRRLALPAPEGTLALFYLQKNSVTDLRMFVRFSTDEAATFGEPVLVTGDPGYHVVNNDRVTQLSTGRLVVPASSTADVQQENHFVSHCYLSDDGGRTWRAGTGRIDLPQRGAMEPEVIELAGGRLMMILRTQLGHIAAGYSDDGGDTWSEARSLGVVAPEAPATIRRIPATGDLLLIWNNTYVAGAGHGGPRTPLTSAVSSDEGRTWRHIRNLEPDAARTYAYTSVLFVQDRALLTYWDNRLGTTRYSSRFRSLPVSWFYEQDPP